MLRPLAWGIAVLATVVFLAEQLTDTAWFRDRARGTISEELGAALGRTVTLRDFELTVIPFEIRLWDFVIEDPDPDQEPLVRIPWAAVEADLGSLARRRIHLREVRVERPWVSMRFFDDGSNLPELAGGGGGEPVEVWIDRARVTGATVGLDHRPASFSVDASGLQARLEGTGESRLAGRILAEEVRLRLPGAASPLSLAIAGRVEVGREGLELRGFRLSNPGMDTRIEGRCLWGPGSGTVPAEPQCQLDHTSEVDAELAAELGYVDGFRGRLTATGNLRWRPATFGWRAELASPRLRVADETFDDLDAQVALDRFGARLQVDSAAWSGGTVRGVGSVDFEDAALPVDTELHVDDVDLQRVLTEHGVELGSLSTRVSGSLRYRFPGAEPLAGSGSADLDLVAGRGQGLPLEGIVTARIRDGVVRTEAARLRAERQSVLARGDWDLSTGQARFEYEGTSLAVDELVSLVPGDASQPWRPREGAGTFEGTMSLAPGGRVDADVHLLLDRVALPSIDFDRVVGGFRVSPDGLSDLRLELQRPGEALVVSGNVPFDDPGIDLEVDLVDVAIDSIRSWVPVDLPIEGRTSGRVELRIEGERVSGRLVATLESPDVLGIRVESLGARLSWDPETLHIDRVTVLAAAGLLEASGDVALTEDDATSGLLIRADGLRLGEAPFSTWTSDADLAGRLDFEAEVAGRITSPEVSADLRLRDVRAGDRRLGTGEGSLVLAWAQDDLQVEGTLLGLVSLAGGGRIPLANAAEENPAGPLDRAPPQADSEAAAGPAGEAPGAPELRFDLAISDLAGLRPLLPDSVPDGSGSLEGTVTVRLPVPDASPWRLDVELPTLELRSGDLALAALEPVRLAVEPTGLVLESLWIASPSGRTEVFLSGRSDGLDAESRLDLRLQGSMAGRWLELLVPGSTVAGDLQILGRVGGTVGAPRLDGQGGVRDGRFEPFGDFPHPFEGIEALVLFYPESVVIDHVRGDFASGRATLEGSVDPGTLRLDLRVAGRGLALRILEGWALDGDLDLALRTSGPGDGLLLTGTARLDRLEYLEDVPVKVSQLFSSFLRRQRLEAGLVDSPLADVHVNLAIEGKDAVRVQNNLADLRGDADLVLRGTLAQPLLFGRVDLEEGSQIVYNDTEYEIQRGQLSFTDPRRIDPEIDLIATTEVREYDVTLNLAGTIERLEASFSSDPPLPDLEVFRLLATGDVGPTGGSGQSVSAASFLYGQAANVIGDRVGSLFGFDQFRIDPLTGGGDNLSSARLTVGKRISRDLYVTYSVDPASTEEQRLRLEWQVTDGFVLVLTQNGDGTYEADARWETRF